MNNLERAIETTRQIRDALSAEIEISRDERVLIRNIDVDGLNTRAVKRAEFNQRLAGLQRTLAANLAGVALDFGLKEVTLEGLKRHAAILGQRLSDILTEVRALASALSELDHLNRLLGQRALSYVRAHLAVLCPKPSAYDRRGSTAAGPRTSTVMRVL